jgi:hypothetical protein
MVVGTIVVCHVLLVFNKYKIKFALIIALKVLFIFFYG